MIKLLSVADLISIINAVFGFLAILFLFSDLIPYEYRLRFSFSFILLALMTDGLDGIVARKIRKSEIGDYLESMADMTSMCIAVAVFIFFIYSSDIGINLYRHVYLLTALVLFLFFGIVRLASFNVMKEKNFYVGLPASASAIILLILSYFKVEFVYILPAVIIIGAAMASNIIFPKPGMKVNAVAAILIILTLVLDKTYYGIAPWLLFVAILLYFISGPVYDKFFVKKQ
jgi:CDP-diacylglycerol--serine O-phosphatidyltransferase